MSTLDFYNTIFKRKSVRKYDVKPLEVEILDEIDGFVSEIKPLFENIATNLKIVSDGEVSGLLRVKAPHYLIMTSENKNGYQTNAGYIFQQIDLYLSSKGIGSCYLGLTQPKKDIKSDMENEVVMVLAFGIPAENVHRKSISEFKRKSLSEITDIKELDNIIEAARLAPSATNSQPWFFTGEANIIHAYCIKPNFLKAFIYNKLNKFDMGIALLHLEVAARHVSKEVQYRLDETAVNNPPKGYYYVCTLVLK